MITPFKPRDPRLVLLALLVLGLILLAVNCDLPFIRHSMVYIKAVSKVLRGDVSLGALVEEPNAVAYEKPLGVILSLLPLVAVFGYRAGALVHSYVTSALFALAAFAVLGRLSRRLGIPRERHGALLAVTFFNPVAIYQFWAVGPDALFSAAFLASFAALDRVIELFAPPSPEDVPAGRPLARWLWFGLYLLSAYATVAIKFYGVVALPLHVIYAAAFAPRALRSARVLAQLAVPVALLLACVAIYPGRQIAGTGDFAHYVAMATGLGADGGERSAGDEGGRLAAFSGNVSMVVVSLLLSLNALVVCLARRYRRLEWPILAIVGLFVLGLMFHGATYYNLRFLLPISPFVAALVVGARRFSNRRLVGAFLAVSTALVLVFNVQNPLALALAPREQRKDELSVGRALKVLDNLRLGARMRMKLMFEIGEKKMQPGPPLVLVTSYYQDAYHETFELTGATARSRRISYFKTCREVVPPARTFYLAVMEESCELPFKSRRELVMPKLERVTALEESREGPASVAITEIMSDPATGVPCGEFIELQNHGAERIDLSGWSFAAGIRFRFPAGTTLGAGERLVVSAERCSPAVRALFPFEGHLDGDEETLRLADASGRTIDEVSYRDDRGWPRDGDDEGRSLERIHPEMPGSIAGSWALGPIGGTPGNANASGLPSPVPVIADVVQKPAVPAPGQSVRIEAQVLGAAPIESVVMRYRLEGEKLEHAVPMYGTGSTAAKDGDSRFGCAFTPPARARVVEFLIEAVGRGGRAVGRFPRSSDRAIFALGSAAPATPAPLVRLVMRDADLRALRERSLFSDDPLPTSFVEGGEIHYDVDVRLRGSTTRKAPQKDFRLDFARSERFQGERVLPIMCYEAEREYIGRLAFEAMGVPSPGGTPVSLLLGDELYPRCLRAEHVSRGFLKRRFGSRKGDVFKGIAHPIETDPRVSLRASLRELRNLGSRRFERDTPARPMADGSFDFRGEDLSSYRNGYLPLVGGGPEALRRIAAISEVIERTPDAELVRALSDLIDVDEWIRYFAARQALGDGEHGLHSRQGIDYLVYFSPSDGRARLMPWDLDQVLAKPDIPLHGHLVRSIMRFLRNDAIAPKYAAEVVRLLEGPVSTARMREIIDRASPLLETGEREGLQEVFARISASQLAQIPRSLSVLAARRSSRFVPFGDERWEPTCRDWDDMRSPLPRCPGAGEELGAAGRLRLQVGQRFSVPLPEAAIAARISVRSEEGPAIWRELVAGLRFQGEVCSAELMLNGEMVVRAEVPIDAFVGGAMLGEAEVPRGLLGAENAALLTIACPKSIVRTFSTAIAGRLMLPIIELRVAWDGAAHGGVILSGRADATRTRAVRVDGRDAAYVPWRDDWIALRETQRPVECSLVEALDQHGAAFETRRVGLVDSSRKDVERRCPDGPPSADVWIEY
jgi:hypothetical protein